MSNHIDLHSHSGKSDNSDILREEIITNYSHDHITSIKTILTGEKMVVKKIKRLKPYSTTIVKYIDDFRTINNSCKNILPSKLFSTVTDIHITSKYLYNSTPTIEYMTDRCFIVHFISKFTQSLFSLDSLHFIHGNIKPSNVFIQFTSLDHFKLYLSDQLQYYMYNSKMIQIPLSTLQFSSPEMILCKDISISTDIWSFGNVLYYFITGTELFNSMNIRSLYLSMKKDINIYLDRLNFLLYKDIPSFILDIIRKCIKFKSTERISPNEVMEIVNKYKIEEKTEKSFNDIHNLLIYDSIHSKCIVHTGSSYKCNKNCENKKCLYASNIPHYSFLLHSFQNLTELHISNVALSPIDTKYISNSFQYISKLILLILKKCSLTFPSIVTLCQHINSLTNLVALNLAGNHLGYNGLKYLIENYSYISEIQLLSFEGYCSNDGTVTFNNLSKEGALYLTEKLSLLTNLRTINIAYNSIDDEVFNSFGNNFSFLTSLEHLELGYNNIGEEGVTKFVKHVGEKKKSVLYRFYHSLCIMPYNSNVNPSLYTLNYLNLSNNYLKDYDILHLSKLFKHMTKLVVLDLSNNYITGEKTYKFFTRLTNLQNLSQFYIENNFLGDIGIRYFYEVVSKLQNLTTINFKDNGITYNGFQCFSNHHNMLSTIVDLNLGYNKLQKEPEERDIVNKPRLRSLKILQIPSVGLNAKGMVLLTSYFQYYTQLYQLTLSNNSINTNGASLLSKYLQLISSLYVLEIDNNKIQTEGMVSLCKNISYLKNLIHLNVNKNIIGIEGAQSISKELTALTNLEYLNLGNNSIGNIGIIEICKYISCISKLEILDLTANSIYVEGISCLSNYFSNISNLKKLYLRANSICDDGYREMTKNFIYLPLLKSIDLQYTVLTPKCMSYLCDAVSNNCLKCLSTIVLRSNPIGIDGLKIMSERVIFLPALVYLDISYSGFSYTQLCFGHNFLRYTPSLKCLKLINNSINSTIMTLIAENFSCFPNLEKLSLKENSIKIKGMISLSNYLSCITKLNSLNVNENTICSDGIISFSNQLSHLPYLRSFNCENNNIDNDGIICFAKNIKYVSQLRILSFSGNKLSESSLTSLVDHFKYISLLKELKLSNSQICTGSFMYLCQRLTLIKSLTSLNLESNKIGSEGIKYLNDNPQLVLYLRNLSLRGNIFNDKGHEYCIGLNSLYPHLTITH